ncbi:MAG: hypothetical protein LBC04_02825 [Holosporaceae bacterium]|jgi:hypothetical protein|nr:hypothetical protein [Holosporaceae bacterium]
MTSFKTVGEIANEIAEKLAQSLGINDQIVIPTTYRSDSLKSQPNKQIGEKTIMNNLMTATIVVKDDISGKSYAYYPSIGLFCDDKLICKQFIAVTALIRTSKNNEWGKRIEFENLSGEICAVDIPGSAFLPRNKALRILASVGFNIACNHAAITNYLMASRTSQLITREQGWTK